ncbi:MAG: neutral/alkaline non-lysosomal ceramidase N-terminal domain-containing protein [Planctomycetes bacterium]|nr:neutral/alkaline non-lysosomal ceramidase N-terminal domain-containing protein [Planctomycetota bacterium]
MKTHPSMPGSLLLVTFLLWTPPSLAADTTGLKAGTARIDITPEKPVTMFGYDARKDLSTGVHDPLSARVLAFEADGKRLVLVSTDLIGFYSGTADYLRQALLSEFRLQPSELFLTAIHNHAGPALAIDPQRGHANNLEYTEKLKGKLIEVVRQALGGLEPVRLGLAVGSCPIGVNRRELRVNNRGESSIVLGRNVYGPTDKEVLVLKVATAEGKVKAVAFDYATHGTCLGGRNYTISGDVLGLAEQFVEKILGSDVIVPAFAGASGDINPWLRAETGFNTDSGWVPEPVLQGTFLGEEVVHVYRSIRQTGPADKIGTAFVMLQLPVKPPEDPSAKKSEGPGTRPLNVTVARLGDVAFVGLGAEVCTEIGMAIKAASPCEHTFVITHCNGAASYLPTKEMYVQDGYEVKTSPFGPQAADIVIRESIRLLHGL